MEEMETSNSKDNDVADNADNVDNTTILSICQKNKELLVFGYIRSKQSSDKRIPIEIMKLCNIYFIFSTTWTILDIDKKLEKFKNELDTDGYSEIIGPSFNVREILLTFQLIATGDSNDYSFFFMINCDKISDLQLKQHIKCVTAYYEFYCIEHKLFCKGTHGFDSNNHSIDWDVGIDESSITTNKLSFDVHIYILNKIYFSYQYKHKNIYYKSIKINKNINYKWNIDNFVLNKFKNSKKNEMFFSPNFNSGINDLDINDSDDSNNFAFTLYCIPKYDVENNNDGLICFGLCLLNLPPKVSKIRVNVILKNECETLIEKNHDLFVLDPYIDNRSIISISIKEVMRLNFNLQIDIIKVFQQNLVNNDHEIINKLQWNDYGVI